jgi:hypothetical protein
MNTFYLDANSADSLIKGTAAEATKMNTFYMDVNSAASLIGRAGPEAT